MSLNNNRDDGREMIADIDWGDDVPPKVERAADLVHNRLYWAFQHSDRVRSLSEDEIDAMAGVRLAAHRFLDEDAHAELRAFENSLNDMSPSDEHFEALSAAWGHVILDNADLDEVDEVYERLEAEVEN